jgi:uncharacterized membrane protein
MNQKQQQLRKHQDKIKNFLKSSIFTSPEGHILLTGVLLGFLYIIGVAIYGLWNLKDGQIFVAMTATHLLFGRAAGMSFGYTMGFEHNIVIPLNLVIETIQVLLFYSLFVFSWKQLLVIKRLRHIMERIHKAAETHRHIIRHYGLLGLFVFVWIPFWMTGSAVGCVLGFLLNLHPWLTVGVVLGGAYVAIISWAILLHELHSRVAEISQSASLIILAIIILIAVAGNVIHRQRRDSRSIRR